jgi:hypothetical protein
MNNTFKHAGTGLEFHMVWKNSLSQADAELVMAARLLSYKRDGFKRWLERPGNAEWTGDVEKKTQELFERNHPPGTVIMVDDKYVAEILGCTP